MPSPAIVVEGVSKTFPLPEHRVHTLKERVLHPFRRGSFEELRAVRDVSFHVDEGEFFGIVGRNGSGKSTLLKLMAGIYRADGGEIWINGRMSTFIELGVGFNPDLAARDNVILNAIMLGLSPAEARERYDRIIDFAELREFEELKLKNYSSGMHVRLAFSVMIQVDADILLIDEVLAVGDASFQQKCFDEFSRLRDAGKTIVLVTHDMGAVRRFCKRAMLVERGEVVAIGEAEDIGARYLDLNFERQESAPAAEVDHDRHGDGRAEITHLWFEDEAGEPRQSFQHGSTVVVRATARFHSEMTDPTVVLGIETDDHRMAFAASSLWSMPETGTYKAGDTATLTLRFRNLLSPGRHWVTPQISEAGGDVRIADRRTRMASFVSSGAVDTGGVAYFEHQLGFEHGAVNPPAAVAEATA